jgi:hypothetical protein
MTEYFKTLKMHNNDRFELTCPNKESLCWITGAPFHQGSKKWEKMGSTKINV